MSKSTLALAFWLPAGKDAFGFTGREGHSMNALYSFENDNTVEQTIGKSFLDRLLNRTQDEADTYRPTYTVNRVFEDAELALRRVSAKFELRVQDKAQVKGIFAVYSNGLYVFGFELPPEHGLCNPEQARAFLVHFVEHHVSHLFHGKYFKPATRLPKTEETGANSVETDSLLYLRDYKGLLTYYQLDLLLSTVFNIDAVSEVYNPAGRSRNPNRTNAEAQDNKLKAVYNVIEIIKNSAIYSLENTSLGGDGAPFYKPLFSERKNYTIGTNKSVSLSDLLSEDRDKRRDIIGRLTACTMEQFIRLANTYGLQIYRDSLQYCRQKLLSQYTRREIRTELKELKRPSFEAHFKYEAVLAPFITALSARVSGLSYFRSLLEDTREDIESNLDLDLPTSELPKKEIGAAVKTLRQAEEQLKRLISQIKEESSWLTSFLNWGRQQAIFEELAESRKISEIAAERDQRKLIVPEDQLSGILGVVAIIAFFVALLEVYFGALQFTMQYASSSGETWGDWARDQLRREWGYAIAVFFGGIIFVAGMFVLRGVVGVGRFKGIQKWLRKTVFGSRADYGNDGGQEFDCSEILDRSGLNLEVVGYKSVEECITALKVELPYWKKGTAEPVKTRSISTLTEGEPSGVTRSKISITSVTKDDCFYIAHLEFRQVPNQKIYLEDIRIVMKYKEVGSHVNVDVLEELRGKIEDKITNINREQERRT